MKNLILLSSSEPAGQDQCLLTFAASMGVSTKTVSIQGGEAFLQRFLDEFAPGTYCLAMSAETLSVMNKASISSADVQRLIDGHSAELLVFGHQFDGATLSWLTGGAVSGITPLAGTAALFALPREAVSLSRQLAGLSFSRKHGEPIHTFALRNATPAVEVIMAANEH